VSYRELNVLSTMFEIFDLIALTKPTKFAWDPSHSVITILDV